jgi:hypothetical protein
MENIIKSDSNGHILTATAARRKILESLSCYFAFTLEMDILFKTQ